jgi:large subunit ribosomal protein L18
MDKKAADKKTTRLRRGLRTRLKIRELGVCRLCVHRTPRHIYAQIIIPAPTGDRTLAAASTLESALRQALKSTGDIDAAKAVGKAIAEKAKASVSPRLLLTAPVSSTTAGSRRWLKPPAKRFGVLRNKQHGDECRKHPEFRRFAGKTDHRQPCGQGCQRRSAVRFHGADRGGRWQWPGRFGLWQGPRSPHGHSESDGQGAQEHAQRAVERRYPAISRSPAEHGAAQCSCNRLRKAPASLPAAPCVPCSMWSGSRMCWPSASVRAIRSMWCGRPSVG